MRIEQEFRGYNRVENSLRKLASQHDDVFERVGGRWAQGVRSRLKSKPYPPKRPRQHYTRTGRFANSWAIIKTGKNQLEIVNRANVGGKYYAGYVAGRETQAWMHAGRWWIAEDEIQNDVPELTKELAEELMRLYG